MSCAAIHTSVQRGSHGIKEKLGISSFTKVFENNVTVEMDRSYFNDGKLKKRNY